MTQVNATPRALAGVRVVDFSRVVAGPICTMILADLGAEVIKIEDPNGGDDTRSYPPHNAAGESASFLGLNRNKRGIVLDLTKPEAREIARGLIAKADILMENFSSGVMRKYGLHWDEARKLNERLIYCAVSAYGRSGPHADRAGFDPITQAESGFMSLNGHPEMPAVRTAVPMIDVTSGMSAAHAILAALYARERLGKGQYVEVALFDDAMQMTMMYGMQYLVAGKVPERFGNAPSLVQPNGPYQAKDGPFFLVAVNDRLYRKLCLDVLNRPDLLEDPRFASNTIRGANRVELDAVLNAAFATAPRATWIARMRAAGVPAGEIRTVAEAFASQEAKDRGIVISAPHTTAGAVPQVRSPLNLSLTPVRAPAGPPVLGEHTAEVLGAELGYDAARIAALQSAGVFGKVKVAG
jgi:crotonobetainyl-CoA:carnitine CoA-transferase CaiB-like acyl-CoA transferase